MLKAFLRAALSHPQLENPLGIPADIIPLSEAANNYEKDHEEDLVDSFENCVYTPDFTQKADAGAGNTWSQKIADEIHQQLLFAFIQGMESFGIDMDDVCVGPPPDEEPDLEDGRIWVISRARDMLREQDEMLAAQIYDFVMELQSCAEENYDPEQEDGQLFEVMPGLEDNFLVIRYDYEAMYNALYQLSPSLKSVRMIDAHLNSAYHVMERYDEGKPAHRLN